MSGDVTTYIGTNYPVYGYAAGKSLSGSAIDKKSLEEEKAELEKIRAEFEALWSDAVDVYAAEVVGGISPPVSGSMESSTVKLKFGAFQVIVVTVDELGEEEWYFFGPSNCRVMAIDGPEPRPMLMDAGGWIIGTGDCTDMAGVVCTATHKFGEEALVAFGEEIEYNDEFDETSMICEVEGELNGTLRALYITCDNGSPDPEAHAELLELCDEMRFIDEHLYGNPSIEEGTYGIVPKLNSISKGNSLMTNNAIKANEINDFYRGSNSQETNYTKWEEYVNVSSTSIKYVASGGITEWLEDDDPALLDQFKLAVEGDLESENPSGTKFLLDMKVDLPAVSAGEGECNAHRYTIVEKSKYHVPEMATYCELLLTPDVMTTVNFKNISSSDEFSNLILDDDVSSIAVSGGSTYSKILQINKLTVWIAGISSNDLPESLSVNPSASMIPIIATHESGLVNYFNVFKKTDGVDPFAGYTVFEFSQGLPIDYKVNVINKEEET